MIRWLLEKKDRRVPTTTDVFWLYHLGYKVLKLRIYQTATSQRFMLAMQCG